MQQVLELIEEVGDPHKAVQILGLDPIEKSIVFQNLEAIFSEPKPAQRKGIKDACIEFDIDEKKGGGRSTWIEWFCNLEDNRFVVQVDP